jgi:poly(A) polymerase
VPKKQLKTYPQSQHRISTEAISSSSKAIIKKLLSHKYKAYIVGGAVRDLLLGQHPKDFDIATNATPDEIKSIFLRDCRIIGRRFRLAHVYHQREMFEVATFRGEDEHPERLMKGGQILRDNVFGSIDQDAFRRDFTCNALYFDIQNGDILDFCGGVEDINNNQLKFIGDSEQRIIEDPIRMIRAIRFQVKLGLIMDQNLIQAIHSQYTCLTKVSNARLFDELVKLFHSGFAFKAYDLMNELGLFDLIFGFAKKVINKQEDHQELIRKALNSTDARIKSGKSVTPIFLYACFFWPLLVEKLNQKTQNGQHHYDAFHQAANEVFSLAIQHVTIPKLIQIGIRNIWMLQFRFKIINGKKVFVTLENPRFRAAYDFLMLRKHESNEVQTLADWWTHIQTLSKSKQRDFIFPKKKRKQKK